MSRRRFAHTIQHDLFHTTQAQTHNGRVSTPFTRFYWCGKRVEYIREDPPSPPTQSELKNFRQWEERMKANPPVPCPKCEAAKAKGAK